MAHIELNNIQKRWGDVFGVRDVNIEIADEEFLVLLGPSGCGKTTTMRMIAGLEDPTEGEIWLDGELMNEVDARDRDVAMVFQGYALYPNMTIYENIRFPLRMRDVPRSEHAERVSKAASLVEIEELLDRKPGMLSGGQRQRAALARAIVRDPRVFLMDEPLSNLDAKLRQSMRVQIKHIQRELKTTTVYVTHDQIEAMTLADRIVIMEGGLVQQVGTPDEIYNDPANAFVAGFIGSPPMNLIAGKLSKGVFEGDGVKIGNLKQKHSGDIMLGFRPEDCIVGGQKPHISGLVYGVEPTGDITYLSLKVGENVVEVKADRNYRAELDTVQNVTVDESRLFFFDMGTGERL